MDRLSAMAEAERRDGTLGLEDAARSARLMSP